MLWSRMAKAFVTQSASRVASRIGPQYLLAMSLSPRKVFLPLVFVQIPILVLTVSLELKWLYYLIMRLQEQRRYLHLSEMGIINDARERFTLIY